MASPHRILAADTSHLVPNAAKAAMDLIERAAVVIAVQSGEDALVEIERGGVDLLISTYALADMGGIELALKANQIAPDLPVVILASTDDPDLDDDTLADSPFVYLIRADQGTQFVQVLRALLDGEDPEESSTEAPAAAVNLGPVPEVALNNLNDSLSTMLTDVGAMAVVLVDREGNILSEMGAVGYLDRDKLTATLAPNFANMVRIGPLVGGSRPQAMHFYDGDEFDIFALAVGLHHFICLIFEGSAGSRAFGAVTMFGRRAVQEMLDAIGDKAFTVEQDAAEAPPAPRKQRAKAATKPKAAAKKKPAKAEPPKKQEEAPPSPPTLEPLPDDTDLESMLAGLDKLDLSEADAMFDPDKLAEIAAEKLAGERLTYEEAQQMGVLES
jgi:DNA-binding NarL/FixJ family response regulator